MELGCGLLISGGRLFLVGTVEALGSGRGCSSALVLVYQERLLWRPLMSTTKCLSAPCMAHFMAAAGGSGWRHGI